MKKTPWISFCAALGFLMIGGESTAAGQVTLVVDNHVGRAAEYGLNVLAAQLKAQEFSVRRSSIVTPGQEGFLIVAGLSSSSALAKKTLKTLNVSPPTDAEGLVIRKCQLDGRSAIVLCGTDTRGLMYAALDTAERLAWNDTADDPFRHVRNQAEAPYVKERSVSMYTMQRAWFEQRLYDEKHWKRYFGLLAKSRINSFVVIFGYENGGFMAPPYPYFFDVPGFSQVEMVGLSKEQQRRNRAAFQRMIDIAHERGIDFVPGIWDHIYRGGVQGGGIAGASEKAGKRVPGLVYGVTSDNLVAYNQAAIRKFLEVFPDMDGIQFRMHGESGLKRGEMRGFWHEIFRMIKELRPDLRVDTRAKELPDEVIADGLEQGIKLRVATKYWMEQMGLPFHPTHVNRPNQKDRRHGYADLLRFPQKYKVHWRMWNGGTSRLLLWADPEYVRRFARSTQVYDGNSLEVNEMLATWMLGEPHDQPARDILNPQYQYYDYPFERYWHYYQVWGRVSYNPKTAPEVWERGFHQRFGKKPGTHLMKGLHLSSQVLPHIVAASYRYRYFPTTRGWAEMMRIDDLPTYASAEGSDIQQFMNPRDAARSMLTGTDTAMRRPAETSRWFTNLAGQILEHVAQAEQSIGVRRNKEYVSTITDLRILAYLARYHSLRLPAGVSYNLYRETSDLFSLDKAVQLEQQAVGAWEQIVQAAGDVYTTNLAFGVHRVGFSRHWQEELDKLRSGLVSLRKEEQQAKTKIRDKALGIAHVPIRRIEAGSPLILQATVAGKSEIEEVHAFMAQANGAYQKMLMKQVGPNRYQYEINPQSNTKTLRYYLQASDAKGQHTTYPPNGNQAPISVIATRDHQPPEIEIQRTPRANPGADLMVSVKATDPSGVKWVRLRYRHLTQFEDYQTVEMKLNPATGDYRAAIPGSFIVPEWDLMYFVEAVDHAGHGRMYPDLQVEMPYVIVSTSTVSGAE